MFESVIEPSPLVSVIMNCYNGEKYLREAIDSVLAQTYTNWEIIFWDNQSTDSSAEIIKSYNDLRIKYYYAPKHAVLYAARNYALEKAKGEYISFLDCDDIWYENKLENQLKLFNNENIGFVCSNFNIIDTNKNVLRKAYIEPSYNGKVFRKLAKNYKVGMLTLMIKKTAFEALDEKFNDNYSIIGDYDIVLRLSMKFQMNTSNHYLAGYREHENNYSKNEIIHIDEFKNFLLLRKERILKYDFIAYRFIENSYYKKLIKYNFRNKLKIEILKNFTNYNLQCKIYSLLLYLLPYKTLTVYKFFKG